MIGILFFLGWLLFHPFLTAEQVKFAETAQPESIPSLASVSATGGASLLETAGKVASFTQMVNVSKSGETVSGSQQTRMYSIITPLRHQYCFDPPLQQFL